MSTRVAVVTGSNKGIGLAIVRALCKHFDGDVYITSRDVYSCSGFDVATFYYSCLQLLSDFSDFSFFFSELQLTEIRRRGEDAVKTLSSEGLKAMFHQLDINDLNSIKTAAAYFKGKYGGVDILINNAGTAFKASDPTPFGVQAEVILKTNFFGTRDMSTHFLPMIRAGGRVVNVSSMLSATGLKQCSTDLQQRFRSEDITEDELVALMRRFLDDAKKGEHKQGGWPDMAYAVSKIGVTVLSMIHARRLSNERPNDGILVNACCPGWVRTDLAAPGAPKSPDEGAITPVYLGLLPPGAKEPQGKYLSDKEVQPW